MDFELPSSSPKRRYRTILVFEVAGQGYGIPSRDVQQIVAMAELHRAPGASKLLAGFLALASETIPVIRLHHLFGLPGTPLGLWTPLVILRGEDRRLALLVDSVHRILKVDHDALSPLPPGHLLNDCAEGIVRRPSESSLLLLSADRLLLQQEAESVAALHQLGRGRLCELAGAEA